MKNKYTCTGCGRKVDEVWVTLGKDITNPDMSTALCTDCADSDSEELCGCGSGFVVIGYDNGKEYCIDCRPMKSKKDCV